jgi:hypothetical protein
MPAPHLLNLHPVTGISAAKTKVFPFGADFCAFGEGSRLYDEDGFAVILGTRTDRPTLAKSVHHLAQIGLPVFRTVAIGRKRVDAERLLLLQLEIHFAIKMM